MLFGFLHLPTLFYTFMICGMILYIVIEFRLTSDERRPSTSIEVEELCRVAREGDVIGVAYRSKRAGLVKVFTGSEWTHCAFLHWTSSELVVVEVARYGDAIDGVVETPLAEWLDRHRRCIVAYRGVSPHSVTPQAVDAFIEEHRAAKTDVNVVHWLKTMVRRRWGRERVKSRYYCSEFVVRFLQSMDIMTKKYDPASYKPWELVYGRLPLANGISYRDARIIKYD